MKINNDSVNTNININANVNNVNHVSANAMKASTSDLKANREWSVKSISQINEYDKGNMPVSERVVIEAIQKANKAIQGGNRRFEFSIHEQTNEIMVKVYDSETDKLIKEIPNEKILDMVAKICEMAGILVDERG